jgi:hypothetical protein
MIDDTSVNYLHEFVCCEKVDGRHRKRILFWASSETTVNANWTRESKVRYDGSDHREIDHFTSRNAINGDVDKLQHIVSFYALSYHQFCQLLQHLILHPIPSSPSCSLSFSAMRSNELVRYTGCTSSIASRYYRILEQLKQ